MGNKYSQEDYDRSAVAYYETALRNPCLLPDVGIDDELLKYSGTNSTAVLLQTFSDALLDSAPGFVESLGSSLASFNSVPNAVGLGAMVISMIIELATMSTSRPNVDSYSMLRRVFGEEKGSAVRDTMSEYLKCHEIYMNNEQRLREDLQRLERKLSGQLTALRNSLQHDGQMSTRGFKIWVNGAAFHLQMLIHEARLNIQSGRPASDYVRDISAAIRLYQQKLGQLLEKYKTYEGSNIQFTPMSHQTCIFIACVESNNCKLGNTDTGCEKLHNLIKPGPCEGSELLEAYMNHIFSHYEPILGLKNYFSNIKNNLNSLVHQRGPFTIPSTRTNG